jgi:hypothetical protein
MLFSKGGCTQGFNTFLTALKGGVSNPFGTNEKKFLKMPMNPPVRPFFKGGPSANPEHS